MNQGVAIKVHLSEEDLIALRSIQRRIGGSRLVPGPSIHSLILKAIRLYYTECLEGVDGVGAEKALGDSWEEGWRNDIDRKHRYPGEEPTQ